MWRFDFNAWIGRAARWLTIPAWFCLASGGLAQSWGPGGNFEFTSSTYRVSESGELRLTTGFFFGSGAMVTVTRTGGALGRATVDFSVVNDTNNVRDFAVDAVVPVSGTLVFQDFQTSASFFVELLNTPRIETTSTNVSTNVVNGTNFVVTNIVTYLTNAINRDALLTLSNPQGEEPVLAPVGLGFVSNARLQVLDDDLGFNFVYSVYQDWETDALVQGVGDPGFIRFTVRCPNPRVAGVSVDYRVITSYDDGANAFPLQPGSDYARPGIDYVAAQGTLSFADDEFAQDFDVDFIADTLVEFNEDFRVIIEDPDGTWASISSVLSITNAYATNDFPENAIEVGRSTTLVTNDINMRIGGVGATTGTILFDGWRGLFHTNGVFQRNIANEQPAGAVDLTWNPDFVDWSIPPFNFNPGANGTVYAIAVQPDGSAVAVGDFTAMNTEPMSRIAKLDTNGWIDTTFQIGTGADEFIQAVAIYGTNSPHAGKIVIGGGFTSFNSAQRYGIARLNTNGSIDASFNPGTGANGAVRALAIQPDDKVVIGGDFTSINGAFRAGVARLNADGSLDTTFDPGGGADAFVWAVGIVTNGGGPKIVIGGDFTHVNGAFRSGIARLNTDGSLDLTFNPGTGANGSVYAIAVQPDQRILIGGSFSEIDVRPRGNIARLNTDGTLDETFDTGTGANDPVFALHVLSNGRILVGGAFTTFNDLRRVGVTRLFPHGPVDTDFLDFAYNQYAGIIDLRNFVTAVSAEPNGNVFIGGSFSRVGGGHSRVDWRPRENIARLVGNSTPGPGTVEFMLSQYRVNENAGFLGAALVRTNTVPGPYGEMLGPITVSGSTSDGLAIAGGDYSSFPGSATWFSLWPEDQPDEPGWMVSDGNTNDIVNAPAMFLSIFDDGLQEGDETFKLHLVPPFGQVRLGGEVIPLGVSLGRRTVDVTIVDDDVSSGMFMFSAPEYVVNENGAFALVTILRTNGSTRPVSIDYRTQDITNGPAAIAGSDYTPRAVTQLDFPSGTTSRTIQIQISDNSPVEEDESFLVVLSNPRGGATLSPVTNALVTIIDDDYKPGRLSFTQPTYSISEAGALATIGVKRTGGNQGTVSASFATAPDSAQPGDYAHTNGVLSWSDGDTAIKTFTVPIGNDMIVEGNENLRLLLSNLVGALPGTHTNVPLTIVEDDSYGAFQFGAAGYAVDEIAGTALVTIVRAGGSIGTVSVRVQTQSSAPTSGVATASSDYGIVSNIVTFLPGQVTAQIAVPILDDLAEEGAEDFHVVLSLPTGGATNGTLIDAIITIVDNESISGMAGSRDTEFNPNASTDGAINAMALQANGSIVIGGEFRHVNNALRVRVARLLSNGLLDTNFNAGQGVNGAVRALALQDDGRIVVGGIFSNVDRTNRNHIARLNSNGSLDTSFNPGAGADNPVNALAMQTVNGARKVLAGGTFTFFNGVSRQGIVRLNDNGSIDATFNPGTGANGAVNALAVQPNNYIIAAGAFTTFNGQPRGRIVRLLPSGALDSTFNTGSGANGEVRAVALQTDGKILVGGNFTEFNSVLSRGIVRLNVDGSVDGSFNPGGGAEGIVLAIAVQLDGRILLGGDFTAFNGVSRGRITRLNPDGSLDPAINFGSGANNLISALLVQPDRKIVAGGGFTQFDGETRMSIVRLHGGAVAGAGALDFTAAEYVVDEDATLATITVRRRGGTTGNVTADYVATNITATAGLDYDAVNGTLVFPEGETRGTFTIVIRDDNQVEPTETVGLRLQNMTGGAQLGANPGAILSIVSDDSFVHFESDAFRITEDFFAGAATITVVRTGTLSGAVTVNYTTVPGNATPNQDYVPVSGRLVFTPGETRKTFDVPIINDNSVEGDETVLLTLSSVTGEAELGTPSAAVLTIAEDDFRPGDLRFSASSYLVPEAAGQVALTIVRSNGFTGAISVRYSTSDDTARSGADYLTAGGIITFNEGVTNQTVIISILDDGLVEGNETFFVTLTNASGGSVILGPTRVPVVIDDDDIAPGSVDREFDPGVGPNALVRSVANQPDGKLVIGGAFTSVNNTNRPYVARLNENGPLDLSFDVGSGPDAFVSAVGISADDRIILGGSFSSIGGSPFNRVGRLQANGTRDLNFNQTPGFNGVVTSLAIKDDGRLVFGGSFTLPTRGVTQLRSDGTIDTAFNPGAAANGPVHAVLVQEDDARIVIGGAFSAVDSQPRTRVARFHLNGFLDDSFIPSEITNGTVFALAQQSDGKIIVGGDFTVAGSPARVTLVRLNIDGSIDTSFDIGSGPNDVVYDLAVQPNDKIIVGGAFTSINGVSRPRFARLLSNGAIDSSFDPGTGANNTVYSIALLPDGDLIIAGDFTLVRGVARNRVARIVGGDLSSAGFTGIVAVPGTNPRLTISSIPGRSYVLEQSADLQNWSPITTNAAVTSNLELVDPQPANAGHRFYRVLER